MPPTVRKLINDSDNLGTPVENRAGYEKWNPMNHVGEWATPTLVIHSGKDYRLVDGEGIGESFCSYRLAFIATVRELPS